MQHRNYKLRGTTDCPIAVYGLASNHNISHWHPEPEVTAVLEGTITCALEDQEFTLRAGDILIINPNQFHSFKNHSEDYRYISTIFSLEAIAMPETHIFQKTFVGPLGDGRLQLPNLVQPGHPAHDTVFTIMSRLNRGNLYRDDSKVYRYTQIVTLCAAMQPYCTFTQEADRRQAPEDRSVRSAMIHIHNFYMRPLTVEMIAAHVHLHPNYLCNVFKKQTGHTVMEHLARTRVDAAKFLLRRDALPMARVAELAGFPSERSFYRQFRLITGMTPKTYQKQLLQPDEA